MKLQIPPLASDIIISVYVIISLYFRFKFEYETPIGPFQSIIMGSCFILILWVLVKIKILNPNWFGLFNSKKMKQ